MIPIPIPARREGVTSRLRRYARRLRRLACIIADHLDVEPVAPARDYSVTGTGQIIYHHPPELCTPWPCPFHAPSPHHMAAWPTHLRRDLPLVERVCPDHGVVHPDPDSAAYLREVVGHEYDLDCHCECGCCHVPRIGEPIVNGG